MIISVINNKGGVGKTTSVQNIGDYLARVGYCVLVVDLDPQANLTSSFGIRDVQHGIEDVLLKKVHRDDAILKSDLDILPATHRLEEAVGVLMSQSMAHARLRSVLKGLRYDFILIDCPPALNILTTIALVASDKFLVPLQASFLSYEGLANLLDFTAEIQQEIDVELLGVFATRYNPRQRGALRHEMIQLAKDQLGDKFIGIIRENIALDEAQALGVPVFDHKIGSRGAEDYKKLTEEIIKLTTYEIHK